MTNARTLSADELRARPPRALVMGGSAGSVEALKQVLPALPRDLGVPVLIVVHLATETRALWPVVFEGTKLPVREAEDKDIAEPGNVYIAPPDYHLLVGAGGRLSLSLDARVQHARPSIDVLFESAAHTYREQVLGVVLSGANADGTDGLAQIARAGGHAWVQSPATAAAAFMPQNALAVVPAARMLGLDDMADVFQSGALGRTTSRGQHG